MKGDFDLHLGRCTSISGHKLKGKVFSVYPYRQLGLACRLVLVVECIKILE
ncbi:hypothetical protein DPMN_159105 [Dreissena polymorpha]|uniref:Uncharacterized protein n=1 Tax=Dreissena polymorpha TaxID=45954 RepID=A0A9D4INV5_DREPO|nr:hypothetical protein DPMN_159105 [Dreissena polymorpha]